MLPIRWDPIRELTSLHREMDNLFRRSLGSSGLEERELGAEGGHWMAPVVDTFVKENTFHIRAELPGVSRDDIDLSVEGNLLTLKGERKEEKETEDKDYHLRESRYGSFIRRFSLPAGAKADDIHASFDNGILEVTVPLEKKTISGRKVMIEGKGSTAKGEKKVH